MSARRWVATTLARCIEVGDELQLPSSVAGGDRWALVVDRPVVFSWGEPCGVALVGVRGVHTGIVWYAIPLNEVVRVSRPVEATT